jgi:hypothetical protein
MPSTQPLVPDDARLREHLALARARGRPISRKTARELATWFAAAIGPGFATFLATGAITGPLYGELARLYDLRQPEVERWLDNLTRFVLAQPVMPVRSRPTAKQRRDQS